MAEDSEDLKQQDAEIPNPKSDDKPSPAALPPSSLPSISLNIWPPSQRTRDAVINRLIENLSTPSILSKRYGTIPSDEAAAIARRIEHEAFDLASSSPAAAAKSDEGVSAEAIVDEGIEILQNYSRDISRRMIESVKSKGLNVPRDSGEDNAGAVGEDGGVVAEPVGEEIGPGESDLGVA